MVAKVSVGAGADAAKAEALAGGADSLVAWLPPQPATAVSNEKIARCTMRVNMCSFKKQEKIPKNNISGMRVKHGKQFPHGK
ncbi:hypothetical protein [Pseudoduganella violacea]|uniref:Uncharacterized protein n=1 Tax=Pseudoduganella violacea TaxID=1715466 RepID=A0A7W5BEH7_9BURK|nr:hypothetical protein [Pseudoduganella violacea]MBB3121696.1 hypothetical protein [Pseudoduganella violacea]